MSYQRRAYDDQDTATQMRQDCAACAASIDLPARRAGRIDPSTVSAPAPSLRYAALPVESHKPVIAVSDAAAHLASRLHLHLD